jgi:GNAT superfamily N-acetyltransferase
VTGDDGIVLRALEDPDVPAAVALVSASLGPGPGGVDREAMFRWKHFGNPFGRSIAFIAARDGEMLGLRTFVRWRFARSGEAGEVSAVRAVDTATAPGMRRRGVFARLTTRALDAATSEGMVFVFNTPNDRSLPGYLKLGWVQLPDRRLHVKVRRPDRMVFAAARGNLGSGVAIAPAGSSDLRPVEELFEDRTAMSVLTSASPEPGRMFTPRWEGYLRWRYGACPLPYAVVVEGSPASALAVVRVRMRGSLREAVVCEAVCEPGAERALGTLLARIPRAAGADHAVTSSGGGWSASRRLARARYVRAPRAGMHFVVRPVARSHPDPLEEDSWALTMGDLEVF